MNFGGIGVVIGHEMTHGFDDQGAKYDLKGNVRMWFTPDDLAKFKERTECYAKEYDGFEVAPGTGVDLNGHLTLGENTADNGGIRIAFQALQNTLKEEGGKAEPGYVDGKRDGYTADQRFFISFAQVWCGTRDAAGGRQSGEDQPALHRRVARQGHRAELRRVRQGLRLQEGRPDDARLRRLPDLVTPASNQSLLAKAPDPLRGFAFAYSQLSHDAPRQPAYRVPALLRKPVYENWQKSSVATTIRRRFVLSPR